MTTAPEQPDAPQPTDSPWVVRLAAITKRFPGVVANQDVDLSVRATTFHAVIGENGAGKSTLLNILYGRYPADSGRLFVAGRDVTRILHSPADAIQLGIALVSQHYALIPALTVLENLMLGAEHPLAGGLLRPRQTTDRVLGLTDRLGLSGLDLHSRADRLSVAALQKVEILKALDRGARILLLDEPTATLAPVEVHALFALLHSLKETGTTIVFVTHKLAEVMEHSDAVTVMRAGRSVASFETAHTDAQTLLREMIGPRRDTTAVEAIPIPAIPIPQSSHPPKQLQHIKRFPATEQDATDTLLPVASGPADPLLQIERLVIRGSRRGTTVGPIDLSVARGEIVGVAGVDGSGQRELAEAIVGLRRAESGRLTLAGLDVTGASVHARAEHGIAYIPEDRHRAGMVLEFTLSENYLLGHEWDRKWGGGALLNARLIASRAQTMLGRYDVRVGDRGPNAIARTLSGGNQQKVVIARAVDSGPQLLVACQPTRGLDVSATRFVYDTLNRVRAAGTSVLLFSLDLDEIFELSDRVAVMFNGSINGILGRAEASPTTVGTLMTGSAGIEVRRDG